MCLLTGHAAGMAPVTPLACASLASSHPSVGRAPLRAMALWGFRQPAWSAGPGWVRGVHERYAKK